MSKFEWHDERLRTAIDKSRSAIQTRLQELNRVSHDVKEFERFLVESAVFERAQYMFVNDSHAIGDPIDAQEYGESAAEEICEYIVWEKLVNSDRWRLMYLRTHRYGWFSVDDMEEVPGGFVFEDEPKVIELRPLIETESDVRLRAHEALPNLLNLIAANTKISRLA
ncbi:MAG: hypothetical protein WAU82_04955 [Candidatus Binatus sp.]|uniref:hypothetical protein n=1 Tax=Candidatus Binatus sp. TaxID=2811406 RepID=UPI003BAF454A